MGKINSATGKTPKSVDGIVIEEEAVQDAGAVILHISGTIDSQTYDELEEGIQCLFDKGMSRIVIDMAGVPYISSAGIAVFVSALSKATGLGGNLVLMSLPATVLEVFRILGIASMFKVVLDKTTAMAIFKP